jgi:2-oxoglutarate dehydrogenase E2 component (dihydrolipoamide succinyltransferase)
MIVELSLPDFDLPAAQPRVSAWHAEVGQRVAQGERLVEITAGDVTVDLAAPASGVLIERCAAVDQTLVAGQKLARIRPQ